ncbi:MAG: alpha/beta hydrolase family protein [Nitrososphaerota archaeon]|nr:alpha/beta hydrolase family protein [Candidatus Bathyarchaeota archaeon]MCX8161541.1 alpha/beta hydrolase family protein [Candidatus Bathyarchaeota archaeon]MDW8061985.1 alpha/beta hydrolase family protein [Nitrososphaerota archaeon]
MVDIVDAPQITDNFILKLYRKVKPSMSFQANTREEFERWKAKLKAKILELLGEFPEPAPLNPQLLSSEEKEDYVREKWLIQSEEDCYIPLYLLIPKGSGRKPAILCAHGHGPYGKDPVAGVHFDDPNRKANIAMHNYNYGEQMAIAGFVTVAPDWRSFGERIAYRNPYPGRDICNVHFLQHLILGRTLLGSNIFDGMRVIDFLLTRREVDPDRIGCMGLSFGGTMTTYLALLDDRIKAADIICYATTTEHYAISRPNFCGSQIVPYLYRYADVPDVIAAVAPKPLLVESGASDTCFWIHSALKAHETIRRAYEVSGHPENLWIEVFPGEHSWSGRKSIQFFRKFLIQKDQS